MTYKYSIILPAKNEGAALAPLLEEIKQACPDAEIIVVDDGSTDDTVAICEAADITVISHRYSMGNGAAIKTGARHANAESLIFMDADGQHQAADIPRLMEKLEEGYDMVVGARGAKSQASPARHLANTLYNRISSWIVGHPIADLTSGFRAVNAEKFSEFLHLLPNGFSYPTTSTMCFFRVGYTVAYLPITALRRVGKSHIKPLKDGIRFLLIMIRVGTLYSPLKLFIPVSLAFFFTGCSYYLYTFISAGRFTNMSALLLSTAVIIFLIGIVSEQITNLMFSRRNQR